jgi:hypothetical protein
LFVTVTDLAALVPPSAIEPNDRLVADTVTGTNPVPLRLAICEPPPALSLTDRVPIREPMDVGVKLRAMKQFFPAARLVPQPLVSEKSPVVTMLPIASAPFPVLLNLIDFAALVDPMASEPRLTLEADRTATGVGVAVGVAVGVILGVGVGAGLAVGVGLGVTDGVEVGVVDGDDVGVEAGIDPSNAPISQTFWPIPGRGSPRWSVAAHCTAGISAIAGLVD